MVIVKLYLTVWRTQGFGVYRSGVDRGWCREMETAFLPAPGDEVVLWPDEDGGGTSWPVESRLWDHDGTVSVHLLGMQVDPSEAVRESMRRVPGRRRAWFVEEDGDDPDVLLRAGGWRPLGTVEGSDSDSLNVTMNNSSGKFTPARRVRVTTEDGAVLYEGPMAEWTVEG